MADHRVKQKLRNEVLPYLVSARRLNRQWFYISHLVFGYTTDVLVALAVLGIGSPALSAILVADQGRGPKTTMFADLTSTIPQQLYYPALVLIICWVVFRIALDREDGQKKAILAKSCRLAMRQAEAKLHRILSDSKPMAGIIRLYEEVLMPTVDRAIPEGAWPWAPFAPDIDEDVEKQLMDLCQRFESQWEPLDPNGLRVVRVAGGKNE
jgi:hypothetical protein